MDAVNKGRNEQLQIIYFPLVLSFFWGGGMGAVFGWNAGPLIAFSSSSLEGLTSGLWLWDFPRVGSL